MQSNLHSGRVAQQSQAYAFGNARLAVAVHNVSGVQACGVSSSRSPAPLLSTTRGPEPFQAAGSRAKRSRRFAVKVSSQANSDKLTVTITGEARQIVWVDMNGEGGGGRGKDLQL